MFGEGKSMRTRKQGFGEWKEFGVVLFSSIVNAIVSKVLRDDREGYERARIKKEIELLKSGFIIKYCLHNTGKKIISTNEYNHNFLYNTFWV